MELCQKVLASAMFFCAVGLQSVPAQVPSEPMLLQMGVPQFFIDDWLVDNRYAIRYKNESVVRSIHPPIKHPSSPVYTGDCGYVNVARDLESGKFQLWTQVHHWVEKPTGQSSRYAIAYAESEDGLDWTAPNLGLFEWQGSKENNVVIRGPKNARASGPQLLLSLPERDKRGFKYVMVYRTGGAGKELDGIRLIGSHDGVHWDQQSDTLLKHIHSDTLNSIVYDADLDRYFMTCRAKDRYRRFQGAMIDTGASRRVSFLTNHALWEEWESDPQSLLIPDEVDAQSRHHFFYGMPVHHYAGIYWGFLWVFRMNDPIHTELVTSRDGMHWNRSPLRVPLIALGADGSWDDGMVFGGPHWVEVGDQWWFYYAGHDGGHDSKDRKASIGLATCPKERLVSLFGPANGGGVVVTRLVQWPGGDLMLNVARRDKASDSTVTVRVSDHVRNPLPGMDHTDCEPFAGDAIRHKVTWAGNRSMNELKGKVIRLEIFLKNADLYTLVAERVEP